MNRLSSCLVAAFATFVVPLAAEERATLRLEYTPAPVDNPLKGLVPYAGDRGVLFPHSMEFFYLSLADVVAGDGIYDWEALEKRLGEIAGRGHQAIFRPFLEYPGKGGSIPRYLLEKGLEVEAWENGGKTNLTPDYQDVRLRKCMSDFIAALGEKYDGDPRIGFITAGLLGMWGEWHNFPRNDLWASKEVQDEVMDAYAAAFKATHVLLRYPAGAGNPSKAANSERNFGYHDDSFAWNTIDTGAKGQDWFFMPIMKQAGALDKWKACPIGGEIRPEAWGKVFDEKPDDRGIQDFGECVRQTHVTWLMDSGMFDKGKWTEDRRKRAEVEVRKMGYEFHVRSVTWSREGNSLEVVVEVENWGVAPFYHDWPVEFALLSGDAVAAKVSGKGKASGLLPGDNPRVWSGSFDLAKIPAGKKQLAVRIANPLPQGSPVRFANKTQDQNLAGWLTLAETTE